MRLSKFCSQILLLLTFGMSFLAVFSQGFAQESDWQLRRRGREAFIRARLMKLLNRSPFHRGYFRQLVRLHSNKGKRASLMRLYRRLIEKKPHKTALKIVLARLLRYDRKCSGAARMYRLAFQERPRWIRAALGMAQCYRQMKQFNKAANIYEELLLKHKTLSSSLRKHLLLKLLDSEVKDGNTVGVHRTLQQMKKERWRRKKTLKIARLLANHHYIVESRYWYDKVTRRTRGERRIKLLIEQSRAEYREKHYKKALRLLQRAQKERSIPRWLRRELLSLEINIYRQQKRLPYFIRQLTRRWKREKNYFQLLTLGRLFDEIREHQKAFQYYRKALILKPTSKEARLYLISWYFQQGQARRARQEIRQLIRHGQAEARHYIELARFLLKESTKNKQPRWNPDWARIYSPSGVYVRQNIRQSDHPLVKAMVFCRSKRGHWEDCRERRWNFWKKYEATPERLKMVREAISLLNKCMRRFPHDWVALQQIEELFDNYGYPRKAKQAFRLLIKATGDEIPQITKILALLRLRDGEGELQLFFRRLMRPRLLHPQKAEILADFVYKAAQKEIYNDEHLSKWQKKRQIRRTYRLIRNFLSPIIRRLPYAEAQKHPLMVAKLSALYLACQGYGLTRKARRLYKKAASRLIRTEEGTDRLFVLCVNYRYKYGLQRLLRRLIHRRQGRRIISYLNARLDEGFFPHTKFLLDQLHRAAPRETALMAQAITVLCRQKMSCREVKKPLHRLVFNWRTPAKDLAKALNATAQQQLFTSTRLRWIRHLQRSYRRKIRKLFWLTREKNIFFDEKLETSLATQLQKIHRSFLFLVLPKLPRYPYSPKRWASMISFHLKTCSTANAYKRNKLVRTFSRKLRRIPAIYRSFIRDLLNLDVYYQCGQKLLFRWLKHHRNLHDIELLSSLTDDTLFHQRHRIQQILTQIRSTPTLSWFAHFGQKRGLLQLELKAIQRLMRRTQNDFLLHRYALLLDHFPNKEREADRYWFRWLQQHREKTTLDALSSFAQRCCHSENDRLMAGRLLWIGFGRYSLNRLIPIFKKILSKMNHAQQKRLLNKLLKRHDLSISFQEKLAYIAFRQQMNDVAIHLYKKLLHRGHQRELYHQRLAILLDSTRQFDRATPHWKAFFRAQRLHDERTFFMELAHKYQRQGKIHLATLAYYRAFLKETMPSPRMLRRQIERLRQNGKIAQAWAHWLRLQGNRAHYCLNNRETRHYQSFGRQLIIWKLGLQQRGPLFFYQPCEWTISPNIQKKILPHLVHYLRRFSHIHLPLTGSANLSREPDGTFLAKERALTLKALLLKAGIRSSRLKTYQKNPIRYCSSKISQSLRRKGWNPLSCSAYKRQVWTGSSPLSYRSFIQNDADNDGVPDVIDHCPLRRGPFFHFSQNQRNGCPLHHTELLIARVTPRRIFLKKRIHFALHSHTILRQSKEQLSQLAALLRLDPSLGKLIILITPKLYHPDPSFFHRFRIRYQRLYHSKLGVLRQVARKDAQRISQFLISKGVPPSRIKIRLKKTPFKLQRVGRTRPLKIDFLLTH